MGQKINPIAYRLSENYNWSSVWYSNKKDYPNFLSQDFAIRNYIKNLKGKSEAFISQVIIQRSGNKIIVNIHTSRPGVVIGKNGVDIEKIKTHIVKLTACDVVVNVVEIRKPELDSSLIAQSIAKQIEKRVSYKRAMKKAIQVAMKLGAKGIRVNCAGRLQGAEIARVEWYREGRVPLQTLRANVTYSVAEAITSYGVIGIKVWVYQDKS